MSKKKKTPDPVPALAAAPTASAEEAPREAEPVADAAAPTEESDATQRTIEAVDGAAGGAAPARELAPPVAAADEVATAEPPAITAAHLRPPMEDEADADGSDDPTAAAAIEPRRIIRGGYRPVFLGQVWAVFRRELTLYFLSPMSYLVWTVVLVASGYLFVTSLSDGGQASLVRTFSQMGFFLVVAVPLLTMRLVAEELRQGTLEIVLCEPMGESAVVLGKFLAAYCFLLVLLSPTLAYPFALQRIGDPDPGPIYAGYLGLCLLSMLFVAIGLWTSTATSNQIAAGTLSFALLFVFWLLGRAADSLGEGLTSEVLLYLSAFTRFDAFRRGMIDTRTLAYIFSLTAFYLFLSVRFLGLRRLR